MSLERLRIEQLRDSGINSNMQRSELVNTLSSQQIDSYSILDLRLALFENLKVGLAHTEGEVVNWRVTRARR